MLDNLGFRQVTLGRYGFLVDPISGRVLPHVRGGADGDDDPPEPKTFSQVEVDRIAGAARKEARQAAANELAAELGCTVEEAKAAIEAKAAADDAAKTEAQRAAEAAAADRQAAAAEKAAAAKERLTARIERKLTAAGVGQGIEDDTDGSKAAAALARAVRLIDLDANADDAAIAAEIDALKAEIPALFTSTEPPAGSGRPPAPKAPAKPASPSTGAKTMAELGRDTLAKAGIRPRDAA